MDDREHRRRQHPRPLGHSSDPRDSEDFVLGRDGKPLVDRYGRPVRRRSPQRPPRREPQRPPRREAPSPAERPQQYIPPRQKAPRRQVAPPPPAAPRPRRRRARSTGGPLRKLGWLVAVVLVLALSLTLWADAQLNRVQALPEQRVANTAGTNWLLVGSDSRQGMSEEDAERLGTGGDIGVGRTDTIMLLHIPNGGQARLVSLPRDSYVTIPGYGDDKINAAFTYGGPQLLTATVENATGLRIDHYAEIGMGGLANVVDAIGGVELCPAEPINDPLARLDIQAGCQTMDGPTALGYVRTRATPMGDLDRVDRQREFFAALIDEATAPNTLLNPLEFFPLVTSTANSFTVGRGDHVWNLARVGLAMRSGVQTETVPVGGFADTAVGNVVLWEPGATAALWESMR
ncbi:transcriptional regulator, LytR family protein [Corynebacterium humireducens NBRC 106098 = DSM 45392]|uniref:Transcriptional regulator, LytR family protein n=1 Tax=Corynebacterium humireducens NBRC 106098 = DSM 45392 TaxID=1223515 RepID=A0A0B5D620_9CORY|nr:LCP family protein [Corynebacterium humireducens]AJE34281.1 transcriptional regulator, LytR family protein [Corynebacterium humireducens NBRC 106098 = DSM 45392]